MIPSRWFITGGAAALAVTFLAIALQWAWPGLYGFSASAAWALLCMVTNRLDGVENRATPVLHILSAGVVVFLLTLLIP